MPRLTFRSRQRLTHARQFAAVYAGKTSRTSGPLTLHAIPGDQPFCRLGLSVGKRAGNAVQRNAFKRRIREAFRHIQHELPEGPGRALDIIIAVRRHEPLSAEEYQTLLMALVQRVAGDWQKKMANSK